MTMMIPLVAGVAVAFWVCAPLILLGGLGVVLSKKPVYSAMSLAVVMIGLAVQYAAQDAPFLFVVQIIVYTGAVLMLFLFVLMLLGIDTHDSLVETLKNHRLATGAALLGFVILLIFGVGNVVTTNVVGLEAANSRGNVVGLAELIFGRYIVVFEATAALLITAAVAAMVLAHGEQIRRKIGQREAMDLRVKSYAEHGRHPGPLPSSGVFANHNSIATPALLPDGTVSELSVSRTLADRGAIIDAHQLSDPAARAFAAIADSAERAEGELE